MTQAAVKVTIKRDESERVPSGESRRRTGASATEPERVRKARREGASQIKLGSEVGAREMPASGAFRRGGGGTETYKARQAGSAEKAQTIEETDSRKEKRRTSDREPGPSPRYDV